MLVKVVQKEVINIISAYAPQSNCSQDEKDLFRSHVYCTLYYINVKNVIYQFKTHCKDDVMTSLH